MQELSVDKGTTDEKSGRSFRRRSKAIWVTVVILIIGAMFLLSSGYLKSVYMYQKLPAQLRERMRDLKLSDQSVKGNFSANQAEFGKIFDSFEKTNCLAYAEPSGPGDYLVIFKFKFFDVFIQQTGKWELESGAEGGTYEVSVEPAINEPLWDLNGI